MRQIQCHAFLLVKFGTIVKSSFNILIFEVDLSLTIGKIFFDRQKASSNKSQKGKPEVYRE